ncbi:hypothetical protein PFICI_13604 [Pestalotiopsis fici W106-1]|uniref:Uncharacterized protein n=1 Tax=Pestalotiopsis fici (strain W106-1 / CGMCC3.15140) TaxID=1229662 RepID=W3WMH9_PESFW|nr:uncharacterized protein PFICI_13604 [Pestalotiopsis fici W106-1]ETS75120.1 hypothetical protein PFICI_13604 [Pestalotiopsis fici W106-1]
MSFVVHRTRAQHYFRQRAPIVHSSIGFVQTLGLEENFGTEPNNELDEYRRFFEGVSATVETAWNDYYIEFFMGHRAAAFPRWHRIETRLRDLQEHEHLADYLAPIGEVPNLYKSHVGWDQLDHVCAFILRLQMVRLEHESHGATPWTKSRTWGAAYVLGDMLHWLHVHQQQEWLKSGEVAEADVATEQATNGNAIVQFESPQTRWGRFWSW